MQERPSSHPVDRQNECLSLATGAQPLPDWSAGQRAAADEARLRQTGPKTERVVCVLSYANVTLPMRVALRPPSSPYV